MTREELRAHCKRQIAQFERIEKIMPVTPNDWKRYEEHKLVLELLEQESCDDCVSRQAVIDIVNNPLNIRLDEIIKKLPPVTPQPKTGYWISWYEIIEEEWGTEYNPHCKCSECSTEVDPHTSKFIKCCPICGAKIIGYRKREDKECR